MKTLILLASLAPLFPAPAHAAPWVCPATNAGPDRGIYVYLNEDFRSANVRQRSFQGMKNVAQLGCRFDRRSQYIRCSEPRLRDAGYSVVLRRSGPGQIRGTVYAITFAGSRPVAQVVCRR